VDATGLGRCSVDIIHIREFEPSDMKVIGSRVRNLRGLYVVLCWQNLHNLQTPLPSRDDESNYYCSDLVGTPETVKYLYIDPIEILKNARLDFLMPL
jgi:hypothetical protein